MTAAISFQCTPCVARKNFLRELGLIAGLLVVAGVRLFAQGAPPMITNDPGTAGPGGWELNFGAGFEHSAAATTRELPVCEIKHGLGETTELAYRIAWVAVHEHDASHVAGLGNSCLGFKWRMREGGAEGVTISTFPQLEFNTPGSSSADRGLVERGTALTVPWQFQRTFGATTVCVETGGVFRHRRTEEWFAGLALSRSASRTVSVGVELLGAVDRRFGHGTLSVNVGAAIDLTETTSLLVAVGRELRRADGERLAVTGYLGWQLRR